MPLKNKVYDIGKWLVFVFLPALAILLSGIGELYSWGATTEIVTTINLFTVFLGSILQISSQKYNQNRLGETGGGCSLD